MLRLVQVHRDLLLDHLPLLADVRRRELRVQQHVHQHVEQLVETVVAGPRMEAGGFLARERIQVAADAFDGL